MSTADTGDAGFVKRALDDAKALVAEASAAEQLELLETPMPEDMLEAREELGRDAGRLTVLKRAREIRRGRKPGSKNRRTDDFARYMLSQGRHPGLTMMEVHSTPPEVLMEASKRTVTRVLKNGSVVTYDETMSYAEAQSLRLRAAEGLMPYFESKKPVAVDLSFNGVADLVIQGVTHSEREVRDIVEAEFLDASELAAPEPGE